MAITNENTLADVAAEITRMCEARNDGAVGRLDHIQKPATIVGFLRGYLAPLLEQARAKNSIMNMSEDKFYTSSNKICAEVPGIYHDSVLELELFTIRRKRGRTKRAINPNYEDGFFYYSGIEVSEHFEPGMRLAEVIDKVLEFQQKGL